MNEILAKRYADAFMKYASGPAGPDKTAEDCMRIRAVLGEAPELIEVLKAPEISLPEKFKLIDDLPAEYFKTEFKNFMKLLLRKGRIDKLNDIIEYIRVNYSFGPKKQVLLKTSYPVELDLIQKIIDKCKERFGTDIKLYIDLDANLLGGVRAVMGNTIIDASARRRCDDLRQHLEEMRVE